MLFFKFVSCELVLIVSYGAPRYGFGQTQVMDLHVQEAVDYLDVVACSLFAADALIQTLTAVPSAGLYYKFFEGWRIVRTRMTFYIDIICALPLVIAKRMEGEGAGEGCFVLFLLFVRFLKLISVNIYLNYLDDRFPFQVFFLRLLRSTSAAIINVVCLAALLNWLACPHQTSHSKCKEWTWLNSYYISSLVSAEQQPEHEGTELGKASAWNACNLERSHAFLLSTYFATATFTATGFGDFSPQSATEFIILIIIQCYAMFLSAYTTSKLTSALSAANVSTSEFELKIFSVNRFFGIHGISKRLRDRIIEHYKLQRQFNGGVALPEGVRYLFYDAPSFISDDSIYTELNMYLEGVPVFSHADPSSLIAIGKLIDRVVVPPNITFVRRGDVRRHLYVIGKGSVAVMKGGTSEVKEILTETGHFGLRDLLYGEPSFNDVVTLSYCIIFVIDAASFSFAFDDDDLLQEFLYEKKAKLENRIRALNYVYQLVTKEWEHKERKPTQTPSWIKFSQKDNLYGYFCSYEEFMEGYSGPFGRICWYLLMHRTVHPCGTFALVWLLLLATASLFEILLAVFDLLPQILSRYFTYISWTIQLLSAVNAYVQLHWAFFTVDNHRLIWHPVQTCSACLLDRRFFFMVMIDIVPYSGIVFLLQAVDANLFGDGFRWAAKAAMIRLFDLPRLIIFFKPGRSATRHRAVILASIYIAMILSIGTFLACVILYLACPWDSSRWNNTDQRIPACLSGKWFDVNEKLQAQMSFAFPRWLVSLYYIFQAIFAVGYGNIVTPDSSSVVIIIFVMVFGYISLSMIQADMTALTVTGDETRLQFLEKMKRLQAVLKKQNVSKRLVRRVNESLEHEWTLSKGLRPHQVMKELHPSIQTDLFREYVGKHLSTVPLLSGADDSTMRILCTYLKKLYFVRGAPITHRGGIEFEMYFIVDGNVWIAGDRFEVKCLLGPGESVGETQLMYGMRRRYTAVAATNVEVLALDAADFKSVLQHYPALWHKFQNCMNFMRADLFERKIVLVESLRSKIGFTSYSRAITRISNVLRNLHDYGNLAIENYDDKLCSGPTLSSFECHLSCFWGPEYSGFSKWRTIYQFIRKNLVDWGDMDVGLPFIYLAHPPKRGTITLLLHPRCGFVKKFSTVVTIASWLSAGLGLYLLVFQRNEAQINDLESSVALRLSCYCEIIYSVHVVLQFITAFPTIQGNYCKEPQRVIFRYCASVSLFWIDTISLVPPQIIPEAILTQDNALRYTHLTKLLRLIHYYRSLHAGYENIAVTAFQYHFITSVSSFFLMIHTLACLYYVVSPCDTMQHCEQGSWTHNFAHDSLLGGSTEPENLLGWRWYVRSLYWVTATITTVGFGDIVPVTLVEVAVCIATMLCGAFLSAMILSQFTHGITCLNKHGREYLYHLKIDANSLEGLGLNKHYSDSFVKWFLLRWEFSRGVSFSNAVEVLPLTIRKYVNLALFGKTLSKVKLFDGFDEGFFLAVASLVSHCAYLPGQIIVNLGENGNTLFIVAEGRVSGYEYTSNGRPRLVRWYTSGCAFGHLPTLFYEKSYTKTYRAETFTEVLTISKHSLFYLCRYFEDFATHVQKLIEARYDPLLGVETIFTKDLTSNHRASVFTGLDKATSATLARTQTKLKKHKVKNKIQDRLHRRLSLVPTVTFREQEEIFDAKVTKVLNAWGNFSRDKIGDLQI